MCELPNEIWYHVLQAVARTKHLTYVWTDFRQTCRTFRDIVEEVFVKEWIPNHMSILVAGGMRRDSGENKHLIEADFQFHSYSEDGTHVTFADPFMEKQQKGVDDEYINMWRDAIGKQFEYGNFLHPTHAIRVREMVNDTTISGMKLSEQFRLTFEWRPTLCVFFREEKEIRRLNSFKLTEIGNDAIQNFKEQIAAGDFEAFTRALHMYTDVDKNQKMRIRKQRMQRQYIEETGHEIPEALVPRECREKSETGEEKRQNKFSDMFGAFSEEPSRHIKYLQQLRVAYDEHYPYEEPQEEEKRESAANNNNMINPKKKKKIVYSKKRKIAQTRRSPPKGPT